MCARDLPHDTRPRLPVAPKDDDPHAASCLVNGDSCAEQRAQNGAARDVRAAEAVVADRLQPIAARAVPRPHAYITGHCEHAIRLAARAGPIAASMAAVIRPAVAGATHACCMAVSAMFKPNRLAALCGRPDLGNRLPGGDCLGIDPQLEERRPLLGPRTLERGRKVLGA
jgi:hypothetical protein